MSQKNRIERLEKEVILIKKVLVGFIRRQNEQNSVKQGVSGSESVENGTGDAATGLQLRSSKDDGVPE